MASGALLPMEASPSTILPNGRSVYDQSDHNLVAFYKKELQAILRGKSSAEVFDNSIPGTLKKNGILKYGWVTWKARNILKKLDGG